MTVRTMPMPRVDERADAADATYRKISLRLLPLLFVCYIAAYLDRVNVGFAKLQMQESLEFSDSVYGFGAGIFFVGYFIFEVPSNLLLHRVGARRWIARIMVTWGLLSISTMFVTTPAFFYLLRFCLGIAEAGFFPGIVLYLTYWFPAGRRGRAMSVFLGAIAFAGVIGGPTSGWILRHMDGLRGWSGWQWMFLLQGLPSVVLGVLVWCLLDDRVEQARWLSADERRRIAADIAADSAGKSEGSLRQVMAMPQVWLLAAVYFALVAGIYGISFWLPSLLKAAGVADAFHIGLLSMLPWAAGWIAMVLNARSVDRRGEHRWHCAVAAAVGAAGLTLSTVFALDVPLALLGLTIATMGVMAALPAFWGLPTGLLQGGAAAAGIALVNCIGNLSGFCAPYLVGLLKEHTGDTSGGVLVLAGLLLTGGVLVLCARRASGRAGQ